MLIRSFIALTLSDDIKKYLDVVVADFKRLGIKVSWTKPGNFHLTLKFLGDIDDSSVPLVTDSLEKVSLGLPSKCKLTSISAFPNRSRPRVIWYGIQDNISENLYQQIQNICRKLGFQRDSKPFKPHLTLGRVKGERMDISSLLDKYSDKKVAGQFESLCLFRSDLSTAGPRYTPLWEKE